MTQSTLLKLMTEAVRKAAKGVVRDYGELENLQVSKKSLADFVTAADIKCEKFLKEELRKTRPGYQFLGEEGGHEPGTDLTHRWIVDPIDGTTNFLHAIPHFAISLALERENQIVAGVIYNPITDDLYWAEKGKGAYQNNRRLRVSGRKNLDEAIVATGIPFLGHGQHAKFLKELHQISQKVAGVRRFGAASLDLAFVAAGRFDAYWERDLSPWDIAAGLLLVTEAGGKWTTADGGEDALGTGSVLAGNPEIHPQILERLKGAA